MFVLLSHSSTTTPTHTHAHAHARDMIVSLVDGWMDFFYYKFSTRMDHTMAILFSCSWLPCKLLVVVVVVLVSAVFRLLILLFWMSYLENVGRGHQGCVIDLLCCLYHTVLLLPPFVTILVLFWSSLSISVRECQSVFFLFLSTVGRPPCSSSYGYNLLGIT